LYVNGSGRQIHRGCDIPRHAGIEEKNTWGQASTDPQTSVADIVAAGSPLPELKHYSIDEPAAPLVSGGTCPFAKDDDFTNAGDDENAVCTTTAQSSLGLLEALDGVKRNDFIPVRDHLKVLDKSLDVCNERLTDVGTCILQHPASSSAAAASPAVVQTVAATKETRAQIHDSMDVVNKLIFAGEQLREIVQSSDTSDPEEHQRIERAIVSFREMVIDKCKLTQKQTNTKKQKQQKQKKPDRQAILIADWNRGGSWRWCCCDHGT